MVKSEFDDCFQNGNYDALRPYHVDNAIILAAGMCSRFKPLSDTKPKAFLKVKGEILIERMIRQLIEAEITEIYIVVGHQKEAFSYLAEKYGVHLIENTEYAVRNNLSSIYAARKVLKNSYICCSDLYCMEIFLILMYMNLITPVLFLQKKQTSYVLLPVLTENFPYSKRWQQLLVYDRSRLLG